MEHHTVNTSFLGCKKPWNANKWLSMCIYGMHIPRTWPTYVACIIEWGHVRTQIVLGCHVTCQNYDITKWWGHCYVVNTRWTDCEQIHSRINNNWCRTFRPHRPLSTAYKTVLYAVDKGLRGRNVLHQLLLILLRICSQSVHRMPDSYSKILQCSQDSWPSVMCWLTGSLDICSPNGSCLGCSWTLGGSCIQSYTEPALKEESKLSIPLHCQRTLPHVRTRTYSTS